MSIALDSTRTALARYVAALAALDALRTSDDPSMTALRSAHDRAYLRARALRRAALALTPDESTSAVANLIAAADDAPHAVALLMLAAADPATDLRPYYPAPYLRLYCLRIARMIATAALPTAYLRPYYLRAAHVIATRADVTTRAPINADVVVSTDPTRVDALPAPCTRLPCRLSASVRRRALPPTPNVPRSPGRAPLRIASCPSDHTLTPHDLRRFFAALILPTAPTVRANRAALRRATPILPPFYPALAA